MSTSSFSGYLPEGLTAKILSQKDRIEGERKQVTVMFCDMEGFTRFSERAGSEEVFAIMDQVNEDATFLEGKCLSYSRGIAYHLVIDVLKSNFNILEAEDEADIIRKVKSGIEVVGADHPRGGVRFNLDPQKKGAAQADRRYN